MSQQTVICTAAGTSPAIGINLISFAHGVGLICTVTGSIGGSYTVQVTGDTPGSLSHWNSHDTLASLSASANGNLSYPVTYVRLNAATWSGDGWVTLNVIQQDIITLPKQANRMRQARPLG